MPRASSEVRIYQEKYKRQANRKRHHDPFKKSNSSSRSKCKWLLQMDLSDKEHKNGVIHSDIEVLIAVKDVIKEFNNTDP